jgi:hypothetical protein
MATATPNYAAYSTIAISPASLASSSDFTAGRESDAVDNTTNKYIDALVSGKITVGTTPTINTTINIYVYAQHDDTPTYPDVLDGTDSAETITSAGVLSGALTLMAAMNVNATTSDRTYWLKPTSVAQCFGGVMPKRWGLYIAHNTGVNLNATGGNHQFVYQGIKYDVA